MAFTEPLAFEEIHAAQDRIADLVVRTPLLRCHAEGKTSATTEVFLKPELLQSIGSFKIRGAANALRLAEPEQVAAGIYTASAGNMAQGVGWVARAADVPFQVVVPDHAPETKLAAIRRLGGEIIAIPRDEWWNVIVSHRFPGLDGLFLHPVCNQNVIAGNGTVGLEIFEQLPDVDAVIVPYGGGGLVSGIASALRGCGSNAKVYACEVATAAPLKAALQAGAPTEVEYTPSYVDGIGSNRVLDEMWPLVKQLVHDSIVVSLDEVTSAMRWLAHRHRLIAEGAGAAALAAALTGRAGQGRIVCVVSGGNIDWTKFTELVAS